ncbi:MAG: ATP-binding protein [Pseudomonadota bacterium]|nr:ATP-binding protein [Pseudomonadota bacterium]
MPRAARPGPAAADAAGADSLAHIVSHDLRAPLRIVEGFARIVKEDYGAVLDRVGHDHLDRILGAATRMNAMIDALLELAKLSAEPIASARVDLSQLAGDVAADFGAQAEGRKVEFNIEPGLVADGDRILLRMVLDNLLGNAWKYSAGRAVARIDFTRHASEPHAYTVADNGAGFDMRYAGRLFAAFQRLHSASEFPGHGIGLASVRRIVRSHGGEVWAEAEPDNGARFHFSLPPSPDAAPKQGVLPHG